jgi:ABC-type polysaccharide/polyol phosphate transport system ATPase subunit
VKSAIALEDVTVRYRRPRERIWTLKEYAIRKLKRRIFFDDFRALHDFSLQIAPGETVGIIGRNGAGKTTLLRLIARVITPTAGRVVVAGRTAPLLELGIGLHGELTGRENILLQGALLGFTRAEMRRRMDRIVEWSELTDFIDAPMRTYSTGMAARLAFSVASDVDPDILLVDEVFAVGDERFQLKCQERMESFRKSGKTILFVSHALAQVRDTCRRAVWIHEGQIVQEGDTAAVTEAYHRWSLEGEATQLTASNQIAGQA